MPSTERVPSNGNYGSEWQQRCLLFRSLQDPLDHDPYGDSYCTRIIKLLFCCFGTGGWFVHQREKFLVPSRYYSYLARPAVFSDAQLLALILQMSHYYYPKSLHWDERFQFQYWESTENCDLLAAYLKEVCNLHLSRTLLSYYKHHALRYLNFMPHILSKRLLSTLVLDGMSGDLLENTLQAISPLLIGDKGSQQLKTFAIKHNGSYCNVSDVTASVISRVLVANQTSLHTIELTSGSIPHHLCSCLSSFFKQPHLHLLRLSGTLRLGSLQEILYAFLTAPRSSSSGEVCLHIEDVHLQSTAQDMSDFKHRLLCLRPHINNHCKSLVLSFSHVQLPHPLITWLQERVVLRLKKLELSLEIAHCFLHQRIEVEEFCIVNYCPITSTFRKRKLLEMSGCKALKCLETPGCFDDVLGNKSLKRFRFNAESLSWGQISEIVLNLARGLYKQAEVGNLEELDLSYNKHSSTPEIFEAIFSLPQIEKLTLVINRNFIDESYLAMLERSWREKAGGKQLKKLIVPGLEHFVIRRIAKQTLQGITKEFITD